MSFCPWVVLQNWRSMPTSTTTTGSSSSLAHSCSGPTLICRAATKDYTATTLFLKDQKDLLASGSTVMYECLLLCVCVCGSMSSCGCKQHPSEPCMCPSSYRVHLTILSGSTVMWTITLRVLSSSLLHNNNRLSSASGVVRLSRHILEHVLPQPCVQCCNVPVTGCDAYFKIRYRLREHMRSHTQERLVACPTCGSMFASNTKFFDHLHRQADPVGKDLFIIYFAFQSYVFC